MLHEDDLLRFGSFKIEENSGVDLTQYATAYAGSTLEKKKAVKLLEKSREQLAKIQQLLYAHNKYGILIVFQAMDAAGDKTIHVHCAANYRVSAFYALYAMHKGLWTLQQAEEHMRGIWNPADYPAWQSFIELQRQRISR